MAGTSNIGRVGREVVGRDILGRMYIGYARSMREQYPYECRDLSLADIYVIWEAYSHTLCAGWLLVEEAAEVEKVMAVMRGYNLQDGRR